jgi:outer membrane protein assembly factor BamB
MQMVLRWKALVILAVCLFARPPIRAAERAERLLAPELLDQANLKVVWQQDLPLKQGETFAALTIVGERLYVRSDRNYLWAMDRGNGTIVFVKSIAPRGIPVLGLASYGNRLITVISNQLVELDEGLGTKRRVSDLELAIAAPVVRNSQFFYISAADRRLHVLRAKDLVQVFPVAAANDSLITSVLADDNLVVFGTDGGNVVAMMPDAPKKLWEFDVPEALAGPVMRDGNSFYFASVDTNVYRVDQTNVTSAALIWKYQTEAILNCAPLLTRDFVYQYAPGRGFTALAKETGKAAWSLPEGLDLLAEAGRKAYVITNVGTLAVMDNVTGRKLYWVNIAPVAGHATNTADTRIYLADNTGRLVCLEPTL